MTCPDVREQLSLLLDDALTASERHALEAHLTGCAECRRELEQLRATVALLQRVPPIHAPTGFVDQVMAEVSRPPWPRRVLDALFRPLRVKLPLEAVAVLLVGVSALYVYQRAPEVQEVARQAPREYAAPPAPPAGPAAPPPSADVVNKGASSSSVAREPERAEVTRSRAREEAKPAPPAASAPAPSGPAALSDKVLESPAVKPKAPSESAPESKKEAQIERRPDAGPTGGAPAPPGQVAQSADPVPQREAAGARPAAPPAPGQTAPSAAPPAPPADARGRAGGAAGAPAPATEEAARDTLAKSRLAAQLTRAVDASGRLAVPAREPAEAALEALLGELGATRVARRVEGPQAVVLIDVVVPGARYHELIAGLGRIGRWVTDYEAPTLPAQVRVEVALTAEP